MWYSIKKLFNTSGVKADRKRIKDVILSLRTRASIRRQIATRKSVQEGKPDRICDLLEEAANELDRLLKIHY